MSTTNFPNGVTNVSENATLGSYGAPDPTQYHTFFDDFDGFNFVTAATGVDPTGAADWSVALTFSAGSPTSNVVQADGGILVLANGTSDDANSFVRWKGQNATTVIAETFRWAADKKLFFKTRFKVSDATQSDLIMGLAISDQSPLDASDGLFFTKADGSASLLFKAVKGSSATTVTVGTLVSDTYITCGFVYDTDTKVTQIFLNGAVAGTISSATTMPDTEELTVTFGIQNGEALQKTMSVDYVFVSKER